ncbi:MAG: MATE family efflux transporter [Clostridiaceae bacterium]
MKGLFTRKDLILLVIPIIVERFLVMAVGMAGTIMISGTGQAAISAISLADNISVLIIYLFSALGSAGNIKVAYYLGARNDKGANNMSRQLFAFTMILASIVTALVVIFNRELLILLYGDTEKNIVNAAEKFMAITAFSFPFMAFYEVAGALFRSMGKTIITLKASVIMNLLNITGNAVLIYGCHMEVEGVAYATAISRIIAAGFVFYNLYRPNNPVYLKGNMSMNMEWPMIKDILKYGLPIMWENIMFQLGAIIPVMLIAGLGESVIAANAVANNIVRFQQLPGMAVNQAVIIVAARCVGARDSKQIKHYLKTLIRSIYFMMGIIGLMMLLGGRFLVEACNLSTVGSEMALQVVWLHAIVAFLIWSPAYSVPNVLRACGDLKMTALVATVSMWVFRNCLSFLLIKYTTLGLFSIWIGCYADWLFRGVWFGASYLKGNWKKLMLSQNIEM